MQESIYSNVKWKEIVDYGFKHFNELFYFLNTKINLESVPIFF